MLHRAHAHILALLAATAILTGCNVGKENPVTPTGSLPIANFTMRGPSVAPAEISFLNYSEHADHFLWDFGDSVTSAELNPKHTYANEGVYPISLTASDSATGKSALCLKTLTLSAPKLPIADFSWTGRTRLPAYVNFYNLSRNATAFLWNFSDGRTDNHANPSIGFNTAGTYLVTLIASDPTTERADTCQKSLEITQASVILDSVLVDAISLTDSSGAYWDPSDGPDVYYYLWDHNRLLLSTTNGTPLFDVSSRTLPDGWRVPDSLHLADWNDEYRIELYDFDVDSDKKMETIFFSVMNLVAEEGFGRNYVLTKGAYKVRLVVTWE